jgi:hypothetical protein
VTLAIMLPASARRAAAREREAREERPAAAASQSPAARAEFSLSLSDFILPEPPSQAKPPAFHHMRQPLQRWSREQIDKYWVPPRDVAAEVLGRINDKGMKELFDSLR